MSQPREEQVAQEAGAEAPAASAATASNEAAMAGQTAAKSAGGHPLVASNFVYTELLLEHLRDESPLGGAFLSRYVLDTSAQSRLAAAGQTGKGGSHAEAAAASSRRRASGAKGRAIFRRKFILLGHQEVGKTSLRKCLESEPYFFRRLPDVRATTGVEVQQKHIWLNGDDVDLQLADFAGQESYHSHTYFLTPRAIFVLVWKISAVEQGYQSGGLDAGEEERLYMWIAEVYAKYPHAKLLLVATHLDELRVQGQRSVEMIISRVEHKLRSFIDRISVASAGASGGDRACPILGNFAVSCKTRQVIAAGGAQRGFAGSRISALATHLAKVAREDCVADKEYPCAILPAPHLELLRALVQVKHDSPRRLLMPMSEFVQLAVLHHIETEEELTRVANLLHGWDVIYLFHRQSLQANHYLVLQPRWLSRVAAAVFSFAHILRTPLHLRSMIVGLGYAVSQAEAADMSLMRKGFLRWPLARVVLRQPLADVLQRSPDDTDIAMCLELLQTMQLLYPVRVACDEPAVVQEETPVDAPARSTGAPADASVVTHVVRYFIPSLAPQETPVVLKRVAPVLFHHGVRLRMEFNLLPDELWWRLQCLLSGYIHAVTVYQPMSATADDLTSGTAAATGTSNGHDVLIAPEEEEELLLDGARLREADEEHSRWRDSLWLAQPGCRVLAYRAGRSEVAVFTAETTPQAAEPVLQALEAAMNELLVEYAGVRRTLYVACPNVDCDGWVDAAVVAASVRVSCPVCLQSFESNAFLSGRHERGEARHFAESLLVEASDLLSFCLSRRSCEYLCGYLGIPYQTAGEGKPEASNGVEVTVTEEAHVEYLHALDKVVQAALFRAWMQRSEERARRRRMLDVDSSPAYY